MKLLIKTLITIFTTAMVSSMTQARDLNVHLDLQEQGAPISPYIYGQFIEHLGRCIYGGIWAEMLEDRKFYFPVTRDFHPYKKLQDTDYPVVGASPWEITGDPHGVKMVREDTFVGEHTPLIEAGSGIRQHDLALVSGKAYTGYLWLKADNKATSVRFSVSGNPDQAPAFSGRAELQPGSYEKIPFTFTARDTCKNALFSIDVLSGKAFVGTLSLMPADNVQGMRRDTIALLKELDAPIYRWPGGNFVSGYNWRDGIGDRDRRPPRKNPAWTGVEHNDFGTDEFISFCRLIETEPAIAANSGFGDAYSAAQWVEYCNKGADTVGGNWRIENGNTDPYNVKVWCVGNEMWGPWQLGFMKLSHYILKHNEVAGAMWNVDPELQLIAVGAIDQINTQYDPEAAAAKRVWSQGMLEECAEYMTYLSEHFYEGRTPWSDNPELPPVEHVKLLKNQIRRISDEHRRLQPTIPSLEGKAMPIAMDEWNYWHRNDVYGELGCVYDLKDALGTVVGLHEYFRQSDLIRIANYAQTVNVIGCIKTTRTAAGFATTGIPLKLYRAEWQDIPLLLEDTFGDYDIAASISECERILTVSVVNPTDNPVTVNLDLDGAVLPEKATTWTLSGPDHRAHNTPGEPLLVDAVKALEVDVSGRLRVPSLSSVLFRFDL